MVKKVLFICLGNICRSPIAEAVFLDLLGKQNIASEWNVDSAAIGGWHEGSKPDSRAIHTLEKHNVKYDNRARQIKTSDFVEYDFIFGMDNENMNDLNRLARKADCKAKILLLGDFDPLGEKIIRDPYYDDGSEGFEKCFQQCMRCCIAFLEQYKSL